jgi:LuxR family maltose regulon positive regulatory protein
MARRRSGRSPICLALARPAGRRNSSLLDVCDRGSPQRSAGCRGEVFGGAQGRSGPHQVLDGTSSIESGAALIRAFAVFSVAGSSRAREAARKAVELEPDEASPWQAVVHLALGYSLYWSGEFSEARALLEDAARLGEATEQPLIVVNALALLSYVEQERDNHTIAEAYGHGALEYAEENMLSYAPQVGSAHVALGKVFAARGELAQAEGHLERGLELQREVGRHPEIADALLTLAFVRRAGGDAAGARELLDEAREWVERCADPGILSSLLERTELKLRRTPRKHIGLSEDLSQRELDVLRLLATELSKREIGESLYLSFNTVQAHTRAIYRKLDVSSREEAVERAHQHGIL